MNTILQKTTKTYAIVGGCGFLGQHLIHQLLNNDNQTDPVHIKVYDKVSSLNKIKKIYPDDFSSKNVEIIFGFDITQQDSLDTVFQGVDTLFHLAAAIAYGRKNKLLLQHVNIEGVNNIITHAKLAGVKKVVYVSSFAALGCLDNQDKTQTASETCEINWDQEKYSYYGLSKYAGEQIVLAAQAPEKTNVSVAVPGLLIGPGPGCAASLMPFRLALSRKWLFVPQGGSNFIDVRDVAHGLIALGENDRAIGKCLLVSHNLEHADLLDRIAILAGHKLKVIKIPRFLCVPLANLFALFEWFQPKSFPFSKEGIMKVFKYRYFSNQKAIQKLSWKPRYTLDETLQDTINWLKKEKT